MSFGTSSESATVVNARVAISYVSVAGAESNLATVGSQSFAAVRARAFGQWNSLLGKIDVSGGTAAEETTFYTALYHALLDPSVFSDADGQYMGFDFKVHTVPRGHSVYSDFSGWDIYRSEVPLLATLLPGQVSDMMQSLVDYAQQGGWLPKWPTANTYTGMVGGDAADPMIADAYAFGARDFNVQAALTYMLKGADDTTSPLGQGVYAPRLTEYIDQPAWGDYLKEGYVPTGADSSTFGTSLTEEFALADFSIGQFAAAIGKPGLEATFAQRGQNWQNVFDPASGYVQPRSALALGDPTTQEDGFEEGDAAQYTWMVPQNLSGLLVALGGDSAAASRLDTFFTQLNVGDAAPYDWAGNEVTLESPWEYDYLGQPWRTQDVVRQLITQLYGPTPGGEPGNDDLGAMSSWYVWAALGLYPETPGTSTLALGSPLFPQAVVHLGNGRTLTINAPQAAADAPYVRSLTVNGSPWPKNYLSAATSGESVSLSVGARSEVRRPLTVAWSATAPVGIQVTPSSGVLTVPPGGQATVPATISVVGDLPAGNYDVSIGFAGQRGDRVTSADVPVAVPASFDNIFGIAVS